MIEVRKLRAPHYGCRLPAWTYEDTVVSPYGAQDRFCVGRSFHIIVSKDLAGRIGWHISVRPWCSNPSRGVSRGTWYPQVAAAFRLLGLAFDEEPGFSSDVYHFHERRT